MDQHSRTPLRLCARMAMSISAGNRSAFLSCNLMQHAVVYLAPWMGCRARPRDGQSSNTARSLKMLIETRIRLLREGRQGRESIHGRDAENSRRMGCRAIWAVAPYVLSRPGTRYAQSTGTNRLVMTEGAGDV